MIWLRGEDRLKSFVENINSFHPTIKFTADSSRVRVHFLDTTVNIENGSLKTDLFNKPTYKHNYLLPSSCHHPRTAPKIFHTVVMHSASNASVLLKQTLKFAPTNCLATSVTTVPSGFY
ncbi:hypothetical protein HOLleu_00605 [Holothuria leucospilota]|uniref:Uncharacterized protein n=1 Tax=Holothuria leucospilota TaxID=206669 RepID=A0A9Q1CPW4_HOLLE|nr:hypothetical protein HOLleu_00605 [Holothuria leucospilota]